jgi:hypothetical protein
MLKYQNSKGRTFHKRSTNVPTFNRNETKMTEFSFPNLPHRKRSCLFCPGEQILDQIETICFQQGEFGNDTKRFWFRFQNVIGTLVLPFLTLLKFLTKSMDSMIKYSVISTTIFPSLLNNYGYPTETISPTECCVMQMTCEFHHTTMRLSKDFLSSLSPKFWVKKVPENMSLRWIHIV